MREYPAAPGNAAALAGFIQAAMAHRGAFMDEAHQAAFRLFNGFSEGFPQLVMDVYGRTLVLHNYAETRENAAGILRHAAATVRSALPWIRTGIVKDRNSKQPEERRGSLLFGEQADDRICEDGTWYAIDLSMGRDAGFYLDTRNVRAWARRQLAGKTVLNAFAYTGSLGVAAAAGGASRVVQLDRSSRYLTVAKRSLQLNSLPAADEDLVCADFFRQSARLRRLGRRFDCVILDPPFFAEGPAGTVDQAGQSARLINKARPLVEDGGTLVAVNNALYLSGSGYVEILKSLSADGYLGLAEIIPVPQDCVGYGAGHYGGPVADPAPFNHPTKIAILKVQRKQALTK